MYRRVAVFEGLPCEHIRPKTLSEALLDCESSPRADVLRFHSTYLYITSPGRDRRQESHKLSFVRRLHFRFPRVLFLHDVRRFQQSDVSLRRVCRL
jgi:hypothetical protein